MLQNRLQRIAFVLVGLSGASASVQKIAPDLYAYISENDSSANATFLISDKGILVVDTGLNLPEGRKLLEEIRKISPLPVRWIVNTHYHPDHRGGNSVVGPEAMIISTAYTRDRVVRALEAQAVENGQRPPPEYLMNESIYARMDLHLENHEVHIYHPAPAHPLGALFFSFPAQHPIATGVFFPTNPCPAMDDGDLENWVRALDQILILPVEH